LCESRSAFQSGPPIARLGFSGTGTDGRLSEAFNRWNRQRRQPMADDPKLVPDGKTVIDGMAGDSLDPRTHVVPTQAGLPGRTSDVLDTETREPPRPSDAETETPDTASAADVLEIIEGTGEDNLTNETVAEKAMERGSKR
jgi:hypothetical protein